MSLRDDFLTALAENEDDTTTRLVYSDWLDEQGEHEEADRQRKWPAAKEWLVRFSEKNNSGLDEDDPYEYVISYEKLLELAREAVEEKSYGFSCGSNMTMCDELRAHSREFWQNWSIVTGIPVPQDVEQRGGFSCAC